MSMDTNNISQVSFDDTGITVLYLDSDDIRVGGAVVVAKQVSISRAHPDYREDMEALYRKVQRLLDNVLEDFDGSEPFIPSDDDEIDEVGIGMGDR